MKLIISLHETTKERPLENHSVYGVVVETGKFECPVEWSPEVYWRHRIRTDEIVWEGVFLDGMRRIDPPRYWYTDEDVIWIENEETNGTAR